MSDHLQPETLALHTGIHRSQFNEHSEAMYLTSSFVFDSAAQAAARFSGSEPGNIYARFCLLYTSPSPRDRTRSRMPSSA